MKRWLLACLLLASVCLLGGCGSSLSAREPEFAFRYAENQAEDYPTTKAAQFFADRVAELTEGRIRIVVYPGGSLGAEASVVEQLQYGGIDFSRISLSVLAEKDQRLYALQLPYLYRDAAHMWRVLEGDIGSQFLGYLGEMDVVGLGWMDGGARSVYTVGQPVWSLADMKGLRIRVQESAMMERVMELMGAVPVKARYDEVLPALQAGRIDGAENNFPSYVSTGHYRLARYIIENEHTRVPEVIVSSQAAMDQLSAADQRLIQQAADEASAYQRELWYRQEMEVRRVVFGRCQVYRLTEAERQLFREATAPVYEEFAADMMDIVDQIKAMRK